MTNWICSNDTFRYSPEKVSRAVENGPLPRNTLYQACSADIRLTCLINYRTNGDFTHAQQLQLLDPLIPSYLSPKTAVNSGFSVSCSPLHPSWTAIAECVPPLLRFSNPTGGEYASTTQTTFHHYRDLWVFSIKDHSWEKVETKSGPTARSGQR